MDSFKSQGPQYMNVLSKMINCLILKFTQYKTQEPHMVEGYCKNGYDK